MFTPETITIRRKSNLRVLNAKREIVLCPECLFGQHLYCEHGKCPCVCGEGFEPSFGYTFSIEAA